jgi:hypothetical protein
VQKHIISLKPGWHTVMLGTVEDKLSMK